jgi:hypothetical protein
MSLIDSTYFTAEINLPTGAYDTVTESIARYERDILIQLLGYDLAKLVIAYNVSTSPQRIKDIVEGKEYTEGDYTVKWNGLVNSDKVSLLAYYVYIEYLRNNAVTFQNVGAVASQAEGGSMVSVTALIQRAGYRLRALAGYAGNDMYAPSLYNFLNNSAYIATYPEWLFQEYKPANAFGI